MQKKYAIGIDIGGTNTDIGLIRNDGVCVSRTSFETRLYHDIHLYVDEIARQVEQLLFINNVFEIEGIGVGAPNGNYYTGYIDNAPNLHFGNGIPLKKLIQERIPVPIVLSNDANAAAYGELIYGGAQGMQHFIMMTIGTGVGSGFVIDGKLVHGYTGAAGELGHSILIPEGRTCTCGRKGCLEAYTSARGICQTFLELKNTIPYYGGILSDISSSELTSQQIGEAAKQGDVLAIQTFERTGYLLGIACANAVTFSSPEAIFLMGGPLNVGDIFLRPIRKSFMEHLLSIYQGTVDIRFTELNANDAAILGAAALLKNENV